MTDTPFSRPSFDRLAATVSEAADLVQAECESARGGPEHEAADDFLVAALDLATEMFFHKGDPVDPHFTDWELPWRKFGGDNPTTSYLSAPVSPDHRYRIQGPVGDATYVGVQVYTKGPGYNAPSANISDRALVRDGAVDLLVGGSAPDDGRPWLPLVDGDYVLMVRVYHAVPAAAPPLTIERIDGGSPARLTTTERLEATLAFFDEAVRSTLAVTEVLRMAGSNAYPPADAPVHRPRYTGALFPTRDNVYDGFWVDLPEGHVLRLDGVLPEARYCSFVFYDRWFCTPDHRRVRCYLTGAEVRHEGDGAYRAYLGPDAVDHPNWIDTGGLRQGIFALRMLLPVTRRLPVATVVPLEDARGDA